MKRIAIVLITIFVGLLLFTGAFVPQEDEAELLILMYHNVIPDKLDAKKYEIRISDLAKDFEYIKSQGYTCVTPEYLIDYTQGKCQLEKRMIMLTFDDGYYYYNTLLQPLLKEYGFKAVISVVGDFTKYNKNTDSTARYIYLDYDDIDLLHQSGTSHIAAHSYNLHKISKGRLGVARKKGESAQEYVKMFDEDCQKLEDKLNSINISPICYTYPYGAYCKESENVIKQRGYKMSLTCNEKVNKITRDPDCLYLLGRFNRDGVKDTAQKIISKYWR